MIYSTVLLTVFKLAPIYILKVEDVNVYSKIMQIALRLQELYHLNKCENTYSHGRTTKASPDSKTGISIISAHLPTLLL